MSCNLTIYEDYSTEDKECKFYIEKPSCSNKKLFKICVN